MKDQIFGRVKVFPYMKLKRRIKSINKIIIKKPGGGRVYLISVKLMIMTISMV
ncbi:MAG: hypothetical protein PWQ67_770 [Clostridia bacterium]|jgi:hypothetical protein|nr:hypothetical protein [Clostridia bacterium]MDN5322316.1 hypothetical protein [Clostridia bacterium]